MKVAIERASASVIAAAAAMALMTSSLQAAAINAAADYTPTVGGTWETGSNWTTNPDYPSGDAAAVTFANAPTATRTITVGTAITVPSITFNNGASSSTNTFPAGTGTSITFDVPGTGTASLTANGTGTGNNTFTVGIVLNDDLVVNSNQTGVASAGISLTGTVSGSGGITKNGPNMLTLNGSQKTYTGPTTFNAGRIRISSTVNTIQNSSFVRVNSGAQITPINATNTFVLGAGALYLNGTGLGAGSLPGNFPGAVRPDSNLHVVIGNTSVVLESTSQIVSAGTPSSSSITFTGNISGPGGMLIDGGGAGNSGTIALNGTNSFAGGSTVNLGTFQAGAASVNAFGTGFVTVNNVGGAASNVTILAGATDAIADGATLTLAGGGTAGVAILGANINEIVGSLVLGGVTQTQFGTYGSTASAADFKNDNFFAGTGVVSLVPEPTSLALLGVGAVALLARRRRGAC